MWVSRHKFEELLRDSYQVGTRALMDLAVLRGENTQLKQENERLRRDFAWAKNRLNQVEHERGMLIQSAIGVKVAVPEFVPTYRPDVALNEDSNPFKTVGEDAVSEEDTIPREEQAPGVDYSKMPGFKG